MKFITILKESLSKNTEPHKAPDSSWTDHYEQYFFRPSEEFARRDDEMNWTVSEAAFQTQESRNNIRNFTIYQTGSGATLAASGSFSGLAGDIATGSLGATRSAYWFYLHTLITDAPEKATKHLGNIYSFCAAITPSKMKTTKERLKNKTKQLPELIQTGLGRDIIRADTNTGATGAGAICHIPQLLLTGMLTGEFNGHTIGALAAIIGYSAMMLDQKRDAKILRAQYTRITEEIKSIESKVTTEEHNKDTSPEIITNLQERKSTLEDILKKGLSYEELDYVQQNYYRRHLAEAFTHKWVSGLGLSIKGLAYATSGLSQIFAIAQSSASTDASALTASILLAASGTIFGATGLIEAWHQNKQDIMRINRKLYNHTAPTLNKARYYSDRHISRTWASLTKNFNGKIQFPSTPEPSTAQSEPKTEVKDNTSRKIQHCFQHPAQPKTQLEQMRWDNTLFVLETLSPQGMDPALYQYHDPKTTTQKQPLTAMPS